MLRGGFNPHRAYVKLDFSQFHDMFHWPFTAHCRGQYPKGWRSGIHHMKMAWHYRRRDQVLAPFHKYILCKLNKHDVQVWYSREDADSDWVPCPMCKFCDFERLPSEKDWDGAPELPDFRNAEVIGVPEEDDEQS